VAEIRQRFSPFPLKTASRKGVFHIFAGADLSSPCLKAGLSKGFLMTTDKSSILRAVLTASSEGIAIIGDDGHFVQVNPAFEHIFEIKSEQVVGVACTDLFSRNGDHSRESSNDLRVVQDALRLHQALPYIEVDLEITDVPRSIGISIGPISTKKLRRLMIVRDITPIRDAARTKTKFLSLVAHELRSPLNAIHGYLDLILDGVAGELNEQQREFVRRARAGSEHLYALLEDLLIISRADTGQLRLNREEASLPEIVANTIEEVEITAIDNGVTITVAMGDEVPPVYVDTVRIQQVLRDLLSNSLRFTPSGGSITITASLCSAASADAEHEWVEVRVTDTGCGIELQYQQRIFERFYQVPRAAGARASGQGLGLAIVKMIVELHGGQVTVESVPGQGSSFSFTLPCL
jgi:PAS domain S-box-containing protein